MSRDVYTAWSPRPERGSALTPRLVRRPEQQDGPTDRELLDGLASRVEQVDARLTDLAADVALVVALVRALATRAGLDVEALAPAPAQDADADA